MILLVGDLGDLLAPRATSETVRAETPMMIIISGRHPPAGQ